MCSRSRPMAAGFQVCSRAHYDGCALPTPCAAPSRQQPMLLCILLPATGKQARLACCLAWRTALVVACWQSAVHPPRLFTHSRRARSCLTLPYAAPPWCARAEWEPQYAPTAEQAALDRLAAYAAGVPHGARRRPRSEAARVLVGTCVCLSPCPAAWGAWAACEAAQQAAPGVFVCEVAQRARAGQPHLASVLLSGQLSCALWLLPHDSSQAAHHAGAAASTLTWQLLEQAGTCELRAAAAPLHQLNADPAPAQGTSRRATSTRACRSSACAWSASLCARHAYKPARAVHARSSGRLPDRSLRPGLQALHQLQEPSGRAAEGAM